MNQTHPQHGNTAPRDEENADLAPATTAQEAGQLAEKIGTPIGKPKQELMGLEKGKYKHTKGQWLFDFSTYIGVTWILNEIISGKAGDWIKEGGRFGNTFAGIVNSVHSKMPQVDPFWVKQPIKIVILCIGGTLVMPLVKLLEDHKDKLVRFADKTVDGEKVNTDPRIQHAYDEMAKEPKQTWISLIQSRGLVMGLAIGLDYLMGHDGSLTTKLAKGTRFEKYSNMERMAANATRDILIKVHPDKTVVEALKVGRSNSIQSGNALGKQLQDFAKAEGNVAKTMGGSFGFVLILSGILTAIFYASSKVFANVHEKKVQQRIEKQGATPEGKAGTPRAHTDQLETANDNQNIANDNDKPSPKVNNVLRDSTRMAAPALASQTV